MEDRNIYPTDSSLCYDCYRTVNRIVENAREAGLSPVLKGFRFHAGKIKTLHFRINQNATAKSNDRKKRYQQDYDTIISRSESSGSMTEQKKRKHEGY